ncbi:MAG TPA: hypothetical protein VJN43_13900, partial [Bryobacteraceae bacterium]|nr:hypothetical protein [Bryobacteraceae bacterium]
EGYVNGVSWFRSHPPFYQRMVDSQREIMYLSKQANAVVTTTEFMAMKQAVPVLRIDGDRELKYIF